MDRVNQTFTETGAARQAHLNQQDVSEEWTGRPVVPAEKSAEAVRAVAEAKSQLPTDPFEAMAEGNHSPSGEWSSTKEYAQARTEREAEQTAAAQGARDELNNVG